MRKICSRDREKLLKFEAEGQEFAKFLRSLEDFIHTVRKNFGLHTHSEHCALFEQIVRVISKMLQILGLQPQISKVFLDR